MVKRRRHVAHQPRLRRQSCHARQKESCLCSEAIREPRQATILSKACCFDGRMSSSTTLSRKEAVLARRTPLQIRTLVAKRENYRKLALMAQDARAGTPGLQLDSAPDLPMVAEAQHDKG